MSVSEKYSDEEWKIIRSLPQAVGAVMAGVKFSGIVGSTKELYASVKNIMAAKDTYKENELIQEIVPNSENAEQAMSDSKDQRNFLMDRIKTKNIKSTEELKKLVLQDCSESLALLESKEDTETIRQYKEWILDIANDVANAAKEGDFLGFGGERFSEKEQKLYQELKTILN